MLWWVYLFFVGDLELMFNDFGGKESFYIEYVSEYICFVELVVVGEVEWVMELYCEFLEVLCNDKNGFLLCFWVI